MHLDHSLLCIQDVLMLRVNELRFVGCKTKPYVEFNGPY